VVTLKRKGVSLSSIGICGAEGGSGLVCVIVVVGGAQRNGHCMLPLAGNPCMPNVGVDNMTDIVENGKSHFNELKYLVKYIVRKSTFN